MLIGVWHLFLLLLLHLLLSVECVSVSLWSNGKLKRNELFFFISFSWVCVRVHYYSEIYLPFSIRQSDQYFRCAPINFIIAINLNWLNIEWNTIRSISWLCHRESKQHTHQISWSFVIAKSPIKQNFRPRKKSHDPFPMWFKRTVWKRRMCRLINKCKYSLRLMWQFNEMCLFEMVNAKTKSQQQ